MTITDSSIRRTLMPDYNFSCPKCGEIIIRCSIKDIAEQMVCTTCGETAKRIFSPTLSMWKTDGAFSKHNHKHT